MGMLKLLFVEDDPDIRDVILIALSLDRDVETTAFENGMAALEHLGAEDIAYRFALLDVRLPGMSGMALHDRLRELPGMSGLRSVLITGAPGDVGKAALGAPGIAGMIGKPFDPLTLAGDVRRMLGA